MDELQEQVRVSKILGMAFVLSITTLGGVGSFIALILGLKALRIIHASQGQVSGRLMAWWCILAGALGTLIITPLTVELIYRQLR